jgi:hypothetical protein
MRKLHFGAIDIIPFFKLSPPHMGVATPFCILGEERLLVAMHHLDLLDTL